MFVTTRCLFQNFSLTWFSLLNKEEYIPIKKFPKLSKELIKEFNNEKELEWSMSAFLLEYEGKKVLFDAVYIDMNNNKIELLNRLKELKISRDEINYIFIINFHWDHIERLIDQNDNIIYKNAKIYVCKEEYKGEIKFPITKKGLLDKIKKIYDKQ